MEPVPTRRVRKLNPAPGPSAGWTVWSGPADTLQRRGRSHTPVMTKIHRERLRFSGFMTGLLLIPLLYPVSGCKQRPPEHGVVVVLSVDLSAAGSTEEKERLLAETRTAMARRLDKLWISRAIVTVTNDQQLHLILPDLNEPDYLSLKRRIVGGVLEFRRVHPESDALVNENRVEPDHEILLEAQVSRDGVPFKRRLLVKRAPERGLTGWRIKSAAVARSPITNNPDIVFEFDADGRKLFAEVTRELSPTDGQRNRLAMVLDGEVLSAPVIMAAVEGGRAQISGSFAESEAVEIAAVLDTPLPAPVNVVEERVF